jgi:peptidoglycan/LPS O-acetylase OafA/YrhL
VTEQRVRPHLAALDGLRGVAILGVLLFHTGHLPGGFLGVNLFFALSGYLITDLLLREVAVTGAASLVAFWGRRIRRLLPALAIMLTGVTLLVLASAASLVGMVALVDPADPTRVYTGTDTRAFSLLLGALVATRPVRDALARMADRWADGLLVLLAAGIGTTWLLVDGPDSPWLFTGGLFVHSLAGALLVGLCGRAPHTVVARVLAWQPLRRLGLISYSVYLWHWPIVVLLSPLLDGWARTLAVWAASIGLGALSKYLVEDPIRFRARWARGHTGLLAFAALMTGLALLWFVVPAPAPVTIDVTDLVS